MPMGEWQSWLSIPPLRGKEYCAEKGTTRSARVGSIFDAINQLISPHGKPKRRIGFHAEP